MSPAQGLTCELRALSAAMTLGEFHSKNPDAVPPRFLKSLLNCTLENDSWETEPGATLLVTGLAENIRLLHEWEPAPGLRRLIAVGSRGSVFKSNDNGRNWILMAAQILPAASWRQIVPVECGQEVGGAPKKLILIGSGNPLVIVGDCDGNTGVIANPTVALVGVEVLGTGNLPAGNYAYRYTWANAIGETIPSPGALLTVTQPGGANMRLHVPTCPDPTCTKRHVYRTQSGDPDTNYNRVLTINDNTTIEVFDDTPPNEAAGLSGFPIWNSTGTLHPIGRTPKDWGRPADYHTGAVDPVGYPVSGFLAEGHLAMLGGGGASHQLYVSAGDDHEDFTTEVRVIPVYPGEGGELVGGFFWKRQAWLFKRPAGVYQLDTSSLDLDAWRPVRLSGSVGLAGPLAYVTVAPGNDQQQQLFDDAVFIAPDGQWHRLSLLDVQQQEGGDVSSLTEKQYGQWIREHVDLEHLEFAQMVYFARIQEIQATVRDRSQPHDLVLSNHRIKANLRRMDMGVRFHRSDFPTCEALTIVTQQDGSRAPYAGGYGQIHRVHDPATYAVDGVFGYKSEVWLHDDNYADLGEDLKIAYKGFHFITVEYFVTGLWPINLWVYLDGRLTKQLLLPMGRKGQGFFADHGITDQSALDDPEVPVRYTFRLAGRARRVSFHAWRATPGQHFRLATFLVGWSPAGITGGNKL